MITHLPIATIADATDRGELEVVLLLPYGSGGVRVGDAEHCPYQVVPVLHKPHVVVIRKSGIPVKIHRAAHDREGLAPPPPDTK